MFYILLILGLLIRLFFVPMAGFKADMAFWKGWGLAVADKGIIWLVKNTNYNYPPGFAYILYLINKIYALLANPYDVGSYWNEGNLLYLALFKSLPVIVDVVVVFLIVKILSILNQGGGLSRFLSRQCSDDTILKSSTVKGYSWVTSQIKITLNRLARWREPFQTSHPPSTSEIVGLRRLLSRLALHAPQSSTEPAETGRKSVWGVRLGRLGIILGLVYFFNPAVLFDGALWGQVDQFGLLLFLLAFYLLLKDRLTWANIVFVISFLMKFQNIVFIPLFYLYVFKKYSFNKLISSLMISFGTFLAIISPFWFKKEMGDLIKLFTINSDYFPSYSLNAFNIWWIASGLRGMQVSDKNLILGILNAKQIGLFVFIWAYFTASISLFFAKKEDLSKKFLMSSILAIFAFFHLLTQSHERYLFPLLGLLLLLSVYIPKEKVKSFLIFYFLFSIFFFLNMYFSMFFNYPDQVLWPFSQEATRSMSLYLSIFQIVVFLYFCFRYAWPEVSFQAKKIFLFAFLILGLIWVKNINYFSGKPISLTSIKPINFRQDYLYPFYNKNLNTHLRPFAFGRLSSNYYFYDKGVASHANSAIVYGLGKRFTKFKTDYGLDTEAAGGAQVYFAIEGDGRELFRSKKMGRFDNPASLEIDIKGVDKLVLKIENATGSIYGAHADWLNPILIK